LSVTGKAKKDNAKYNLGCAYSCLECPQTFRDDGPSITPLRVNTYWQFTYTCSACGRHVTIPAKTFLYEALLNEVVNRCGKFPPDTKPLDAVHQCAKEERKFFVTRELWDKFAKEREDLKKAQEKAKEHGIGGRLRKK
jgi:hypothetical protein